MWRVEKLTVTEESYSRVHEKHREWQKQSFNCFQISVFIHNKDLICIIMTSEPHTVFASPCFSHCPLVAVHSFNMNMYSFLHFCSCTDFHIWVMLHFLLWVALPALYCNHLLPLLISDYAKGLFYSIWASKALRTRTFLRLSAFCVTFIHIHSVMDTPESNLGFSNLSKDTLARTARDETTNYLLKSCSVHMDVAFSVGELIEQNQLLGIYLPGWSMHQDTNYLIGGWPASWSVS